jgi:hypothetical protein
VAVARGIQTPAQVFALVIGIFYLATGLAGFVTAGTGSADVYGILGVNALHNVIHIVVFGAAWIWAAFRGPAIAKTANLVLGAALVLICLLGLVGGLGWLNIDSGVGEAHFWLTLVTGAVGIYFGTAGAELGGRPRAA